jgi:polyhydroxyalkanoate synthase subunit PhaC
MNSPFNMPDEYVQGFFKAGQSLLQALTPIAGPAKSAGPAGEVSAPSHAAPLAELQLNYFQQQLALWARMMSGAGAGEPLVAPERGDRRFNAAEWRENPAYSLLKQSYLLNSRLFTDVAEAADLDDATKHKLRFYTRQFVDAMSPANFAATNPDVLKAAFESKGESVKAGFENLLADLRKGGITTSRPSRSARPWPCPRAR